jgi:hypothetical protein
VDKADYVVDILDIKRLVEAQHRALMLKSRGAG